MQLQEPGLGQDGLMRLVDIGPGARAKESGFTAAMGISLPTVEEKKRNYPHRSIK